MNLLSYFPIGKLPNFCLIKSYRFFIFSTPSINRDMKHQPVYLIFVLTCSSVVLLSQSISQSTFASQGGSAEIDGSSISWTLGQPIIGTLTTDEYNVTQGFHQPISNITTSFYNPTFSDEILLFPNPTFSAIQIRTEYQGALHYAVVDVLGRVVAQGILDQSMTLNTEELAGGVYLITFHDQKIHLASLSFQKL